MTPKYWGDHDPKPEAAPPIDGVRIFISSTFQDMEAERTELIQNAFPRIRRWCEGMGLSCTEIDLRWGVTNKEMEMGLVLPICLQEVDRCRPFFVGLLGGRYGWIEPQHSAAAQEQFPWLARYPGRSLTELEIVYGALEECPTTEQTFFYFRDESTELPGGAPEPEDSRRKLAGLKRRIAATGRMMHPEYRNARELAAWVIKDLQAAIRLLIPHDGQLRPNARERARQQHFADLRSQVYIGAKETISKVAQHYRGSGPPLLILGEPGEGKSTLLSAWRRLVNGRRPEQLVLFSRPLGMLPARASSMGEDLPRAEAVILVSAGLTAVSSTAEGVANLIIEDLRQMLGRHPPSTEWSPALAALPGWIAAAASQSRVALMIDGVEHLPEEERTRLLAALPHPWPAGVRLIVATAPGDFFAAARDRGWEIFNLSRWGKPEIQALLELYRSQYRKGFDAPQLKLLLDVLPDRGPLYARTVLEELRVTARHRDLTAQLRGYIEAPDVPALYLRVLERWERVWDGLPGRTLKLLAVACRGLAESELREILGQGTRLSDAVWAPISITIETQVPAPSGFFTMAPGLFRQAVERRFFSGGAASRIEAHRVLADYFEARPRGMRQAEELPWHLIASNQWDRLAAQFGDAEFLIAGWKFARHDLLASANCLEASSPRRLADTFGEMTHRAGTHFIAGSMLFFRGHFSAAGLHLAQAEIESRASGDSATAAEASSLLASIELRTGKTGASLSRVQLLEAEARAKGDLFSLAIHLGVHGENLRKAGRLEEAVPLIEAQMALAKQLGDEAGRAAALGSLGALEYDRKGYVAALAYFEQQSALYEQLGDQLGMAAAYGRCALTLSRLDRRTDALALYRRQERIARHIGDRWTLLICLGNQAALNKEFGHYDIGMRQLDEKERLARAMETPGELAVTWLQLSQMLMALGDKSGASYYAVEAEKLAAVHELQQLGASIAKWTRTLEGG